MFPHFVSAFIQRDEEVPVQVRDSERRFSEESPASDHEEVGILEDIGNEENRSSTVPALCTGASASLRQLDLENLSREAAPITEVRNRKEKLARYEKDCSQVGDRLFVGGEAVAKNREILSGCQITHVVNCVGVLYPSYFEDELKYQTLYLQDSPKEDILAVLYDVFDFIEDARSGGNVFVHCSQGVSRSTSLAIAYRMWRERRHYEDVFAEVKQLRGVANPNIGFICQLMQWHKRRAEHAQTSNVYRIAPQSMSAPTYLVPKWMNGSDVKEFSLDPRGTFVVQCGKKVYLWRGADIVAEEFMIAAYKFVNQLRKYETEDSASHIEVVKVDQGKEPEEFWKALDACITGRKFPRQVVKCPAFDADFDIWTRASFSNKASDILSNDTCDSARSGRKTPRVEPKAASSPNDRLKKQARSNVFDEGDSRACRDIDIKFNDDSNNPSAWRKSSTASRLAIPTLQVPKMLERKAEASCSESNSGDDETSRSLSSRDSSREQSGRKPVISIPKLNFG